MSDPMEARLAQREADEIEAAKLNKQQLADSELRQSFGRIYKSAPRDKGNRIAQEELPAWCTNLNQRIQTFVDLARSQGWADIVGNIPTDDDCEKTCALLLGVPSRKRLEYIEKMSIGKDVIDWPSGFVDRGYNESLITRLFCMRDNTPVVATEGLVPEESRTEDLGLAPAKARINVENSVQQSDHSKPAVVTKKRLKNRRGPKKTRDIKSDTKLVGNWEAAKRKGQNRGEFCRQRSIKINDLEAAQRSVNRAKS